MSLDVIKPVYAELCFVQTNTTFNKNKNNYVDNTITYSFFLAREVFLLGLSLSESLLPCEQHHFY